MRVLAWFSCGAASAVAAKLAVEKYGDQAVVVYCDTMQDEHPDNQRFFDDVQAWVGVPIQRIKSDKYASIEDVFTKRRYMSGVAGAICTGEMKKVPRFAFQRPDDVHVFGLRSDETDRIDAMRSANPELRFDWILRDQYIDETAAKRRVQNAGIKLPAMYALGYEHNNCLGCVKATSPRYWNMIRRDFPDVYERRAAQSRELGVRLARVKGERIFLDELAATEDGPREAIECGPQCVQTVLL